MTKFTSDRLLLFGALFVVSAVSRTRFEEIVREIWPFILVMVVVLFVLCFYPGIVLWLPNLLG